MKPLEFPPQAVFLVTGAMLQLIMKGETPQTENLLNDNDGNVWHVTVNPRKRVVVLSRREKAYSSNATATTWEIPVCNPTLMATQVGRSQNQPIAGQIAEMDLAGPVLIKIDA